MNKLRKNAGFAFIELILAVSILAVLVGLGIAIESSYVRSLTKLKYDGYAKEIFVAAQNHLAMAASQNYMELGRNEGNPFGTDEQQYYEEMDLTGGETGVRYFYCAPNHLNMPDYERTVLSVVLPVYAIDETLRARGHFILRYHPDAAQALDVFYWENTGARFSHDYAESDYSQFLDIRNNKDALKNYGTDHSVIGYYGGFGGSDGVDKLTKGEPLKDLSISVTNGDKLSVLVTNPNASATGVTVQLIITGTTSNNTQIITLPPGITTQEVTLDDITSPGGHFFEICPDLIPGENITIQAVAFSTSELTNVVYSSTQTTNSLFGDDTDTDAGTAEISNIRHLENLSTSVSNVNSDPTNPIVTSAAQNTDLDWDEFVNNIKKEPDDHIVIYPITGDPTEEDCYLPVTPEYPLNYDGQNHTISNIKVDGSGDAGLFGELSDGSSVENLKLVDFDITSEGGNAGALAGSATGATITNVVAVNSKDKDDPSSPDITGKESTGGLIGSATDCAVTQCAASLVVESTGGDAGGLIGTAEQTDSGSMTISASYSGCHTENGSYSNTDYNVTGAGNTGGLVGSMDGGTIAYSYSTCSASGGETVGGLVGSAVDTTIEKCYATGLVNSDDGTAGAFAGELTGGTTCENCTYYEIVNERPIGGDPANGYENLPAVGGGDSESSITPFDSSTELYNIFVGDPSSWDDAIPYDSTLIHDFKGDYPYKTVEFLSNSTYDSTDPPFVSTHYGDWPALETFVVNTKTS